MFDERSRLERGTCIACSYTPQKFGRGTWEPSAKNSAEIDHARGTIFGSKCEQLAISAPRERRDRRIGWLACEHLGAVIDAYEQNESVGVAGRDHRLLGVTRD